tara:strand:+ start:503 stop:721 length:219 start_codon:yes stop_codon:yes gene_type:complete
LIFTFYILQINKGYIKKNYFFKPSMKKKTKTKTSDMGTWSRKMFGYTKDGYLHFGGKKTKLSNNDDYIEDED